MLEVTSATESEANALETFMCMEHTQVFLTNDLVWTSSCNDDSMVH